MRDKKTAITEKMRRLVNDVMRAWAPPKKETPRDELSRIKPEGAA